MRSVCLIVPLLVALVCSAAPGADKEDARARKVKVALALAAADAPKAKETARTAKVAKALEAAGIPSPAPFVTVPTVAPAPMPREVIVESAPCDCLTTGECACGPGCKCRAEAAKADRAPSTTIKVAGRVQAVESIHDGKTLAVTVGEKQPRLWVLLSDPESKVTLDGKPLTDASQLAGFQGSVIGYSRLERYGAATEAAFTSATPAVRIVKRPKWFTDYDAAIKDSAGKTVVVLFTDPVNCLPCKKLEAGALADPAVRDELARCVCVRLDVRSPAGEKARALFAAHGDAVTAWPTLKVYRAGIRVADHVGDCSAETLLKLIR